MIKVICDLCGEIVNDSNYQTNLEFSSFGISKGPRREYQLHASCANAVKERIDKMMKARKEGEPFSDAEKEGDFYG